MRNPVHVAAIKHHPTCSHRVHYPGPDGKRRSKYFITETDALKFAKSVMAEAGFNGSSFGTITDDERAALTLWRSFTAEQPAAPDLAVILREAVRDWRQRHSSITLRDALARFIAHQQAEGASTRHTKTIESRIGRLVADHGEQLVASIDTGKFADWLNALQGTRADKVGAKLSMVTRDNLKKSCRSFFGFCIERGWTSTNPVSVAAKKRTRDHRLAKRKAPAIMHPEQIQQFLDMVEEVAPAILPFWLVKFFAGIRDAEAARLDWSMIDLKKGSIHLPAAITKTGDPRKVTIQPTLAAWIKPYSQKAGPLVPVATTTRYFYKKVLRHLRRPITKGGKPQPFNFPSNAARHSFGTFHLFHFRDPGETALQLGHKSDPTMLWEHYANPAAEEHAAAFWVLESSHQKIITMSGRKRA